MYVLFRNVLRVVITMQCDDDVIQCECVVVLLRMKENIDIKDTKMDFEKTKILFTRIYSCVFLV
jgi:hypothetical protein